MKFEVWKEGIPVDKSHTIGTFVTWENGEYVVLSKTPTWHLRRAREATKKGFVLRLKNRITGEKISLFMDEEGIVYRTS